MVEIDTNLYSRQIGTFGMEAMAKLIHMKVLISGMKGLGVETAKNLILAGPGKVTLHDDHLVEKWDLGANFYLTEEHVGTTSRARASLDQLQALNNYVRVDLHEGLLDETFLAQFSLVVLSESDRDTITQINEVCRRHNIGFISCEVTGAAGYVFVDYGTAFRVFDKTGEENKSFILANISQGNPGIVQVHDEKRHTYEDGDYVVFKEVQGMTEINAVAPMPVKYINRYSFSIGDTSNFSAYTREGIVEQVKVPVILDFRSYADSLKNPVIADPLITADLGKFGRPEQLHIAYQALRAFQVKHHHLPGIHSVEDATEVVDLAKEINAASKEAGGFFVEEIEEGAVRKLALYSALHVSPLAAFFGGVVAQEVVKYTGKYTPLRQWLYMDWFEIVEPEVERPIVSSRFRDQIALIGINGHNRLEQMNAFVVGAGALGCEYLKGFALMGVSCGGGVTTVTDDDNIEVSNLNRQFLFRKTNVGMSKSACAAQVAKGMNTAFNVVAKQDRVSPQNETIFTDGFWDSLDVVVGAVDNVNARLYVDGRCVWYGKYLLESGTLGTKANVQIVVPNKTQSYGDSQDPPEESIPMCTLKNFPHAIEHCIEWSRDEFEGSFCDGPKEVLKFLDDPQKYLTHLPTVGNTHVQREKLETIKRILHSGTAANIQTCVDLARQKLEDLFHNQIAQLLHNFPVDYRNKEGTLFWSGPKRAPEVCVFNPEDEDHLNFIVATANLFAYQYGVPLVRNREEIKALVRNSSVAHFAPRSAIIQTDEKQEAAPLTDDDEEVLSTLMSELRLVSKPQLALKASEFEKDDDSNFHIDFIHAASNLRARNYRIPVADRQKSKMIAGKIIPAIATTTAMITGGVLVELYKRALEFDVDKFRNCFINLALPLFVFSEPMPPNRTKSKDYDPISMGPVKAYPEGFTTWDKLIVEGPCTLAQFMDQIKQKHHLKTTMVSAGRVCMFNGYLPGNKHADRLLEPVHKLYERIADTQIIAGRHYLAIEVSCETEAGEDVTVPTIKYVF